MHSSLYDQNLPTDIIKMPETILITNADQPLITATTTVDDIDIITNEKDQSDDSLSSPLHHTDGTPSMTSRKQKSLISVYDNNPQQQASNNAHSLVGIIGRNKRSEAFRKRLLSSGFPKPVLCDINSTTEIDFDKTKSNYVSYEMFYESSPTIILVTDNLTSNFEDFFPQDKQQLVVDTRETFSERSSTSLSSIPGSYRAFGNLSNWEIEHGTHRIGVAVERYAPVNLIKFIYDLNCFSRGIYFLDQYSYDHVQIQVFRNCLFPLIATILIFITCWILSMIEYTDETSNAVLIYRQASSVTASTSITLLALLFLIRPVLELIDLSYSVLSEPSDLNHNVISNLRVIQHWLQSRCYLAWYSISFALLHIIFIVFSKVAFDLNPIVYGFFFGILTLILLCILSYAYFPWISERLSWNEYHCLTSYLGPFCLFIAFIHVVLQTKSNSNSFNLKSISLILPLIVLILRFTIYGIIHPVLKLIQWLESRQSVTTMIPTRDASLFL